MEFENIQDFNTSESLEDVQDSDEEILAEENEASPEVDDDTDNGVAAGEVDDDPDNADDSDNDSTQTGGEFSLDYAFDDEIITVTDRDEAASLMQQGRLYQESEEIIQAINLISARTGTPPIEVAENLLDSLNRSELERCIAEADGDSFKGNQLYQQRLSDAQKAYDESRAKRTGADIKQRTETRLAEEFLKYKDELPYDKVSDIPAGVISLCVKEKQSLLAAELIYRHREDKKIKANEAKKQENQTSAPGNISKGKSDDGANSFFKAILDA